MPLEAALPAALSSSQSSVFPTGKQATLSILIVSWNVWPLLRRCLDSIERNTRPDPTLPAGWRKVKPHAGHSLRAACLSAPSAATDLISPSASIPESSAPELWAEVIVVDNGSHDATCSELPGLFPWVRLIDAGQNLGFTGGNNLAYTHATGDFIYFLNPDTELLPGPNGENSLWALWQTVNQDASVVLAGPRLFYADGSIQSTRRRFPTRWTGFFESTQLARYWPRNPWARAYRMEERADPDENRAAFAAPYQEVDWVVGAAMLARRDALEAIRMPHCTGPFDQAFFMYSEEVDLCRRLRNQGGRVVFVPQAQVRHYEGRSSQQVVAGRMIRFNRSKVTYARKYFGPLWAQFLRAYLLLEFVFMWSLEASKWLLGSKRSMRAARMAQYRQVLADGLAPMDGQP